MKLRFSKSTKTSVYQQLQKSKTMTKTYEIHENILQIDPNDLETVEKIFKSLVLNFKIV